MRIFSDRNFDKQFARLDEKVKKKFYERIALFTADPHTPILHDHSLEGAYVGMRSINITGDIRAVYYESTDGSILFAAIGTHHQLFGS